VSGCLTAQPYDDALVRSYTASELSLNSPFQE